MTTTLQRKPLPVAFAFRKRDSLTRLLARMGVTVQTQPLREHITIAQRIYRRESKRTSGLNVGLNNLWNAIKRHVCPVCGGVKLRQKSGTCSVICGMDLKGVRSL